MQWSVRILGNATEMDGVLPLLKDTFKALSRDDPVAYKYQLFLRFVVVNSVAIALVAYIHLRGWIDAVLAMDMGHLCLIIALVFAAGLVMSSFRALQLSRELNDVKARNLSGDSAVAKYFRGVQMCPSESRQLLASALRLRVAARVSPIRYVANSLVLLGLIGTVIGFIIALNGVKPDSVSDVSSVGPMVATLVAGMSVALYTTLVGSVLHIWLMVNVRLLEGGTVKLLAAAVELGETHVRP